MLSAIGVVQIHHNHSCDCETFYDKDGEVALMVFREWDKGNDKQDAM